MVPKRVIFSQNVVLNPFQMFRFNSFWMPLLAVPYTEIHSNFEISGQYSIRSSAREALPTLDGGFAGRALTTAPMQCTVGAYNLQLCGEAALI